jgi:hypothetical protein
VLRIRFSATRNGEGYTAYDERTTTLDAWLDFRWVWALVGLRIEAGPIAGYARMSRPMYVDPINGFLAGLAIGVERPLLGGFGIILGVDATWASFNPPPIAIPAPPGFDNDADGDRLSLSLGLAHRWTRSPS